MRIWLGLVLLLAGCIPTGSPAGSGSLRVTPAPEPTAGPSAVAVIPAPALPPVAKEFDRQFLDAMIARLQTEMELARIAVARAQHQELKDLAQELLDMNPEVIEDMQQLRQASSSSSAAGGAVDTRALTTAPPERFDAAFIDVLTPLLQQTLDEARQALLDAGQQEVLDLAGEMMADRSRMVLELQTWREQWR